MVCSADCMCLFLAPCIETFAPRRLLCLPARCPLGCCCLPRRLLLSFSRSLLGMPLLQLLRLLVCCCLSFHRHSLRSRPRRLHRICWSTSTEQPPGRSTYSSFRITVVTELIPLALGLRVAGIEADAELHLRLPILLGVHLVSNSAAVERALDIMRPRGHGERLRRSRDRLMKVHANQMSPRDVFD